MNLTINFVWIGAKPLGWVELFMIYSWRLWGCQVNLFTHYPNSVSTHDHRSLGLPPDICTVYDLPTMIRDGETMEQTRRVLRTWFGAQMPLWDRGGKILTFNTVDLCKSYLAATTKGIVLDMKIGPSPHIKQYVESEVFDEHFVSYVRVGTIENQCMGSMRDDDGARATYGRGFEQNLFQKGRDVSMKQSPLKEWFGQATAAHGSACGKNNKFANPNGLKGTWFDIGTNGRAQHVKVLGISKAEFKGIAGEKCFGPFRIFKREDDQSNKFGNTPTTNDEKLEMRTLTFSELAKASTAPGGIDVTAAGMPPVASMLDLLSKTTS